MSKFWYRVIRTLIGFFVVAGVIAVPLSTVSAIAEPVWGNGTIPTFPNGVQNTTPSAILGAVSCPTQADCVAVGSFYNSAGGSESFLMTSTNATWTTPQRVSPSDEVAAGFREAGLASVSCSSPGYCTAVGSYLNSNQRKAGFSITSAAGSWGQPQSIGFGNGSLQPHPTYANAELKEVSCPTNGNCTAVGFFTDTNQHRNAIAITLSNGTWGLPVAADLTTLPDAGTSAQFNSVSCSSAGNCTAVGQYANLGGDFIAFTMTSTDGNWANPLPVTFSIDLPPRSTPDETLSSVSCSSPGYCTAVGYFSPDYGDYQALFVTSTNGNWSMAQIVTYNVTLDSYRYEELKDVSCTSPGTCTAVGYYNGNGHAQPLVVTSTDGTLSTAQAVSFASVPQSSDPNALLQSVSCWSAGNCTAIGRYKYAESSFEGFSITSMDGTWAPVRVATASISSPNGTRVGELFGVSCGSTGLCTVVGSAQTSSGREAFTMRSSNAPAPAPSTTAAPTTAPSTTLPAPALATISALPPAPTPIVTDTSIGIGEQISVSFGGFTPFEYVQLVVASTPRVIGSGYANAQGIVTITGSLPSGLAAGSHTLAVYAPGSGVGFSQPITVSASTLPVTGSAEDGNSQLALWALTLGIAAIVIARRRQRI